jgi:serine/threonine protein kinase
MSNALLADRYRLDTRLGGGCFGEVWQAKDTYFDRSVAVKLFARGVKADIVLAEARLQVRLSAHPNIVTIEDVVVQPPRPFVVTQLYTAGDVDARVGPNGAFLPDAMRWMRDLLAGLRHAHSLNVIHRDVKPSNLLVTPNGGAALTDFGIAEDSVRGIYAGRASYNPTVAPEILANNPSSEQTDLWAAACTWYRLLCGRYPFLSTAAIVTNDYEPAYKVNAQIPMALSRAIDRGLNPDPSKRYADAARMLGAVSGLSYDRGWERIADPAATETWRLHGGDGDIVARLIDRPKAGPELVVTRDRGRGPRAFIRERPGSLAQSRQKLRALLRRGVESGL